MGFRKVWGLVLSKEVSGLLFLKTDLAVLLEGNYMGLEGLFCDSGYCLIARLGNSGFRDVL